MALSPIRWVLHRMMSAVCYLTYTASGSAAAGGLWHSNKLLVDCSWLTQLCIGLSAESAILQTAILFRGLRVYMGIASGISEGLQVRLLSALSVDCSMI